MITVIRLRLILILILLWAAAMTFQMLPYRKAVILKDTCDTEVRCRYTSPIAALELATTPKAFEDRIDQNDRNSNRATNTRLATVNTYLDLVFIFLYWAAFVFLARTGRQPFKTWTILVITLAAIFDLLEDASLFHSLRAVGNTTTPTWLPGIVSHVKWVSLAIASLLLFFSLFKNRTELGESLSNLYKNSVTPRWLIQFLKVLVTVSLVLSGLFTLLGQFSFPLLALGTMLLALAFVASLALICPIAAQDVRLSWLNYLYFIRFSIFLWLVMPTLALLDWLKITTSITLGILTPETGWQLFFSSFFIITSGWLALTLARIVCAYGEERFGTAPPAPFTIGQTMNWSTFLLAQLPGSVLIARVAVNASVQGEVPYNRIVVWFLLGALVAFVFWLVVAILYYWTYQPSYSTDNSKEKTTAKAFLIPDGRLFRLDQMEALPNPPVAAAVRRILAFFGSYGDGYRRTVGDPTTLHSGHSVALFLFFGYFGLYIGLMGITAPRPLPVVEHIIQAITIIILFIAALNYLFARSSGRQDRVESNGVDVGDGDASTDTDSVPKAGVSSWYRFLSRFAVGALLLFAAIIIWQPRSDRVFPVLASVFVLFTFATLVLSGVAFWADHYRIPVLTLSIAFITLTNLRPLRVDHQFEGIPLDAKEPSPVLPRPTKILQLMEPGNAVRPLVVITSTGGGIHAAMWTAEVLEELEKSFSQPSDNSGRRPTHNFHDSILLASTVSGGSVGMMNFLREYKAENPFQSDTLDDHLVSSAACSSLEAVAWGVIYPDLARTLSPILFRSDLMPARYDRGLALEQAINFNLSDRSCDPKVRKQDAGQVSEGPTLLSYLPPSDARSGRSFLHSR
jgi:hypothetical protein